MLKMRKHLAVLEVTLTVSENEVPDILSSQMQDHLHPRRQAQKSTRVKKVCHTSISPTAAVIKTANLRFKSTFMKLLIQSRFNHLRVTSTEVITAQKMKFSIQDFFRKCDQIRRKLQILSHLLKKSLTENFIFLWNAYQIAVHFFFPHFINIPEGYT